MRLAVAYLRSWTRATIAWDVDGRLSSIICGCVSPNGSQLHLSLQRTPRPSTSREGGGPDLHLRREWLSPL